ncbi:hypothetical protein [Streptomyces canus]|nr:hypothetical protein [Streptomyces canus]MDQ0764544.1 hypothetical protein [Streptomyces canus]
MTVATATDARPTLRCIAGSVTGPASAPHRVVPTRAFDKQISKLSRPAG